MFVCSFGNIDRLMMVYVCQTCSGLQNVRFKNKKRFSGKSQKLSRPVRLTDLTTAQSSSDNTEKKKGVSTERSIQIYMNRYTSQYEQVYKSTKISSTTVSLNIFAPHTTSWTLSSKAFRRQQSHRRTISRGETAPTCILANRERSLH